MAETRTPEAVADGWMQDQLAAWAAGEPFGSDAMTAALAALIREERKRIWIANSDAQQRFRDDGDRAAFQAARRLAVEGRSDGE